ncbi:hypothetical protein OBK31_13395 [Mycobacterium avium subsp. paratuberculosis K-10]|nr:hypothetical protein [Mycobacterium avium]UYB84815.1 hypothetical protein OBK31_13395 [Mycobacterium avium subsp. paratuberculosis K-10]
MPGIVGVQRGPHPLGEQRVRGVHHRVVGRPAAHPGLRRAPPLRLGHRAVTGERVQVGDRQRLGDGQVFQHRVGRRRQLGEEGVDLARRRRGIGRLDVDSGEQAVVPQRRDGVRGAVGAGGDDQPRRAGAGQLVHQGRRQHVQLVGVVDDQQQAGVAE